MTAPAAPTRPPRTMVAVMAALQAVALRIDEAGISPDQINGLSVYPRIDDVTVHLRAGEVAAFDSLVALYPHANRMDATSSSEVWPRAVAETPDGTVTIWLRAVAGVTP